jgi:hypothetical protein
MFSRPFYLAFALVSLNCHSFVIPQTTDSKNNTATTAVSELLTQLGHSEFAVRERATSQILDMGPPAIQALQEMPLGLSKEARHRVALLLDLLEQKRLKEISQSFLVDANNSNAYGLPGWHTFRDLVGANRNVKLLFLEVLKSHSEIALQVEQIDKLRKSQLSTVDQEAKLSSHCAMQSGRLLDKLHRRGGLEIGDSVAMLFAASTMEGTVPFEVSELIRSMSRLEFAGALNRPGYRPSMLQLLGQWIPKSPESMAPDVMELGRKLDLKQVLPISRRHISKSFDLYTREQAIYCLVQFGDLSDVDELLKYADEGTVIHQYEDITNDNNPIIETSVAPPGTKPNAFRANSPVQKLVRVNDLAVAAAMMLKKEDPRQVFPNFSTNDQSIRWRSVAVLETEQKLRDDAIHTWIAQLSRGATINPKQVPIPDSVP